MRAWQDLEEACLAGHSKRAGWHSPVAPALEEVEKAGNIVADLGKAQARCHPQKHRILLHEGRLFIAGRTTAEGGRHCVLCWQGTKTDGTCATAICPAGNAYSNRARIFTHHQDYSLSRPLVGARQPATADMQLQRPAVQCRLTSACCQCQDVHGMPTATPCRSLHQAALLTLRDVSRT